MSVLEVLAIVLGVVGILGNILPGLPGTPIAFVGLILAHISDKSPAVSTSIFIFCGILTLIAAAVDYIAPMLGAKKFGGSKYGSWGAILGLLVGLFTLGPIGLIVGPLVGAIAGEMYANKQLQEATVAGFGAVLGMLASALIKLVLTSIIVVYIFKNVF